MSYKDDIVVKTVHGEQLRLASGDTGITMAIEKDGRTLAAKLLDTREVIAMTRWFIGQMGKSNANLEVFTAKHGCYLLCFGGQVEVELSPAA